MNFKVLHAKSILTMKGAESGLRSSQRSMLCCHSCLYSNKEAGHMMRCCWCMTWYHEDCVNDVDKGVWCCSSCRESPRLVKSLSQDVSHMKGIIETILNILQEMKVIISRQADKLGSLRAVNTEINKQLEFKEKQLSSKCEEYEKLNTEYVKLLSNGSKLCYEEKKLKTLLIGSSMIRDIRRTDSSLLEVHSHSGATLSQLSHDLDGLKQSFDHIIIVGGGNDCSDKHSTTTDVCRSMTSLLEKANKKAKRVTVSSILPRPREPETQLKKDHVKESIQKVCNEKLAYNYVSNDGVFKLSDMSPNDGYYNSDGVHLSHLGTKKLVSNLGLNDICSIKSNYYKKELNQWHKVSYRKNNDRHKTYRQNNQQETRCYTCGEPGHVARTCRFQQKNRCFPCGMLGHKSHRCTHAADY